ncbi:MAG TPA: carbon-nitrogen hydrolase family protein [Blastocatellia bacterium]|nr:carbon-nitrogen hydrolase family protein [Blastocatellia bacterium]
MGSTIVACAQIDCEIGNPEANRRKIVRGVREAAEKSASLVVFPECALTGYSFESLEEASPFAEPLDGPSSEEIASVCAETGLYAIAGFIEKDEGRFYNSAMIVGPDGVIGSYRKVHLPFLGVDRFLSPGDRPFDTFRLPFGRVGINICYDSSFPEAARVLKLMGAEVIILPTNWPPGAWRNPEFVIQTRAMENHINFIAVNRVGVERGWHFIGKSKAIDYNGDTIISATGDGEEMFFAKVDLAGASKNKVVNVAGSYEIDRIEDRRPEFYEPIVARPKGQGSGGSGR